MCGTLIGCLVASCLVVMLAGQTEGHFTFFSPKEMREMMNKEKLGIKAMISEPGSHGEQFDEAIGQVDFDEHGGYQGKSEETKSRLTAKHLDRVAPALEEMFHKVLTDAE